MMMWWWWWRCCCFAMKNRCRCCCCRCKLLESSIIMDRSIFRQTNRQHHRHYKRLIKDNKDLKIDQQHWWWWWCCFSNTRTQEWMDHSIKPYRKRSCWCCCGFAFFISSSFFAHLSRKVIIGGRQNEGRNHQGWMTSHFKRSLSFFLSCLKWLSLLLLLLLQLLFVH